MKSKHCTVVGGKIFNLDELVKSRHTREGGYLETLQLSKKTGFPIKDFGNDGLKRTFYESVSLQSSTSYCLLFCN